MLFIACTSTSQLPWQSMHFRRYFTDSSHREELRFHNKQSTQKICHFDIKISSVLPSSETLSPVGRRRDLRVKKPAMTYL